jgi:starch-binding outer membrane protein, SusD/RagB family
MLIFDSHINYHPQKQNFLGGVIMTMCLVISSCKKLVDIPPPTQSLAENNTYATDAGAIGVLNGLYISLTQQSISGYGNPFQYSKSIGLLAGLSADELNVVGSSGIYSPYYKNQLSISTATSVGYELWPPLYNLIFRCNGAIEGLQKSSALTPAVKKQLLGEAKFMRAFFYFYLVNLFGDVPLALSTDPLRNSLLSRSAKSEVYWQIIADLQEAKNLLSSNFLDASLLKSTSERVRPTQWAATALLARTYLYTNKFDSAELYSSQIINNATLYDTVSLNKVFLKNSKEAIWQLQPTVNNFNTLDGLVYIIPSTGPTSGNAVLTKFLLNTFDTADQRAALGNWINRTIYNSSSTSKDTAYYVFKYKVANSTGVTSVAAMTEYFMVLRLAEQYLIRAEARAQQNNIGGAQSDLNIIRTRAGLPNTTSSTKDDLLSAILNERRHELFCEWGHRWLDLKRTGKVDAVMSVITPLKANGLPWQSYQQLYPLQKSELDRAPNLTQTPGY